MIFHFYWLSVQKNTQKILPVDKCSGVDLPKGWVISRDAQYRTTVYFRSRYFRTVNKSTPINKKYYYFITLPVIRFVFGILPSLFTPFRSDGLNHYRNGRTDGSLRCIVFTHWLLKWTILFTDKWINTSNSFLLFCYLIFVCVKSETYYYIYIHGTTRHT